MSRVVRTLTTALLAAGLLVPGVAQADVRASPESTVTFDGTIQAMAYLGDRLYLGGDFTHAIDTAGKLVARTRLAALDARTGKLLDWNPIADGRVRAIAASERGIFVGGDFGSINGLPRDNLAQLDPVTGLPTGFRHSIYGHPHTIAVGADRIYVGGTITRVDGVARSRLAAFDLATGTLDPQWTPAAEDSVNAILVSGDRAWLGGAFSQVNGLKDTARLAMVELRTGAVSPAFRSTMGYAVSSLSMTGGVLYAAVAGKGGRAMALDPTTGATKWTVTADGDVQSVVRVNDTIVMGGHFDRICKSAVVGDKGACRDGSTDRVKLAALDLSGRLLPWIADANGIMGVESMAVSTRLGKVAAGGSFTQINGAQQRRFAQFRL